MALFNMNWNQSPMSSAQMGDTTALAGLQNMNQNQIQDMQSGIFSRQGMFGQAGWVQPMTAAVSAGAQLWQGMQQMDLMKEQLAFQKDTFAKNWSNQVKLTNDRMYDQYAARQAGYGQTAQSKSDYLAEEGVQ